MPYIVPQAYPAPQTGFGDFANALGNKIESGTDLLLKAYLSGLISPKASAGQYTAPGGQTAFISPAERVASNPNMSAAQAIQNSGAGTFNPTRFSGLQFNAPLDRQVQQAQINKSQWDINPTNPANQLTKDMASVYKEYADQLKRGNQSQQPQNGSQSFTGVGNQSLLDLPDDVFQGSQTMKGLYSAARAGDQISARKIRMLALEKDDPVAISLLQALGEL